jgi:uncharacterized protein YjbJ (UPF0337 family)
MNKDQVRGRIAQVKGELKQAAGRMTGNRRMQGDGLIDQARGKARAGYGDAKARLGKVFPR